MVKNLFDSLGGILRDSDWMDDATKAAALNKVEKHTAVPSDLQACFYFAAKIYPSTSRLSRDGKKCDRARRLLQRCTERIRACALPLLIRSTRLNYGFVAKLLRSHRLLSKRSDCLKMV